MHLFNIGKLLSITEVHIDYGTFNIKLVTFWRYLICRTWNWHQGGVNHDCMLIMTLQQLCYKLGCARQNKDETGKNPQINRHFVCQTLCWGMQSIKQIGEKQDVWHVQEDAPKELHQIWFMSAKASWEELTFLQVSRSWGLAGQAFRCLSHRASLIVVIVSKDRRSLNLCIPVELRLSGCGTGSNTPDIGLQWKQNLTCMSHVLFVEKGLYCYKRK